MRVRTVLGNLLDRVAASPEDTDAALAAISDEFIADRNAKSQFDWRYYLMRYASMREGNSGIYYGANEQLGYELTMLRKTVQRSWYRDAYLYAIWCECGQPGAVEDPWFYGYSTTPRWMKLAASGTGLRSVPTGIAIWTPARPEAAEVLEQLCHAAGTAPYEEGWLLPIEQAHHGSELVDSVDRVQVAARFLQDLIDAGL
jgi:hypothetical protein